MGGQMYAVGTANVVMRRFGVGSKITRRGVVAAAGTVVASALLVPLASSAQAVPAGCHPSGGVAVCDYSADTTFTVPAGVTSLSIEAIGGSGAPGAGSGAPGGRATTSF